MSDTTLGIEVDGDRVTVVESLDGIAVSSQSVAVGSLEASLELALSAFPKKKNGPPIRVALVAGGTTLRRIDVTSAVLTQRDVFEDVVFDALPAARDSSLAAGLFFDVDSIVGDSVVPGVAAVMPRDLVESVYRALGDREAEVVPSPLLLQGRDGIWLGLHLTAAEATLVRDGRPVAFRQLRAGGLGAVAAVLGDEFDREHGRQRLLASLTRSGAQDALADAEVNRYLRMVGGELQQTVDFWARQGETIEDPRTVFVYGLGGSSPAVRVEFAESEMAPALPEDLVEQLAYIQPSQREEAALGVLAADSIGEQVPQAVLPNPAAAELASRRAKSRRRAIRLGSVSVVAVVLVAVFGYPFVSGYLAVRAADAALAQAQAQAGPLLPIYQQTVDLSARQAVIATASAQNPDWPKVLDLVYGTRPSGATITRLSTSVSGEQLLLVIEADKPGGSFEDMSAWIDALVAGGATQPWSPGFSDVAGLASYEVTVSLPLANFTVAPAAEDDLATPAGPSPTTSPDAPTPAEPSPLATSSASASPSAPAPVAVPSPSGTPATAPPASPSPSQVNP